MNKKCEKCGADMVELFSSSVCSNDCKGDTPLETPEGYDTHAANIKGNPKYPEGTIQYDDKFLNSLTEEKRQQQKKKMLKALANFNTTVWLFIGQMDQMLIGIDNVTIAFKKLNDAITQNITFPQDQLVDFDRWQTGIHSGTFNVYQHKTKPLYRIEARLQNTCWDKYSCAICGKQDCECIEVSNSKNFGDPLLANLCPTQPIQTVKWDHIDPSIKESEEEMVKALGIPSHIIDGVKDNCEKIRGQRITQTVIMDEYCNLDKSIFENVISSLKDGASYKEDKEDIDAWKKEQELKEELGIPPDLPIHINIEKEKIKIQIEKLSPEDGDLLIFRMPPSFSDKDYHYIVQMLDELELDAKSIVIPDSITVEHVSPSKDKDNDTSKK